MDKIRLVTRADDAAMNGTANRAIRAAVRQGIVRNVSVMATGPALESAADLLADLADQIDFGFHVCFTAEWANARWGPVSQAETVPSLLRPDKTLPFNVQELAELDPKPQEVRAELEAQLALLKECGFAVSYVDEHMEVGRVAAVRAAIDEFVASHGFLSVHELMESGKLLPLPNWEAPGAHPGTELADHLATVEPGTYLLVGHPAFKSEEMERVHLPGEPTGEVQYQRNRERRMFADIEIVDYCDNVGIKLCRLSEIS